MAIVEFSALPIPINAVVLPNEVAVKCSCAFANEFTLSVFEDTITCCKCGVQAKLADFQ